MSYNTIKITVEANAVDIPTMEKMPIEEYREYLKHGLIHIDHHEIIRSLVAGYPLACNKAQLKELINHLTEIGESLRD